MSEDETPAAPAEVVKKHRMRQITCPCCHTQIALDVHVVIADVRAYVDATLSWRETLLPEEEAVLAAAEAHDVLPAFEAAARACSGTPPKNIPAFFLTFLKTAVPRTVPVFATEVFRRHLGPGHLEVWGAQGLLAVSLDQKLRLFIPLAHVSGTAVKNLGGKFKGRLSVSPDVAEAWVKGRHGYVPAGTALFGEALKQRNIGGFGRLVQ